MQTINEIQRYLLILWLSKSHTQKKSEQKCPFVQINERKEKELPTKSLNLIYYHSFLIVSSCLTDNNRRCASPVKFDMPTFMTTKRTWIIPDITAIHWLIIALMDPPFLFFLTLTFKNRNKNRIFICIDNWLIVQKQSEINIKILFLMTSPRLKYCYQSNWSR